MMHLPIARLALGTVQFGMPYGVSNAGGQVPEAEVRTILAYAAAAGIDLLDTAAAYGTAEATLSHVTADLGRPFQIVSKTPPRASVDAVVAAARHSADLAGSRRLDALLVHHPTDLAGREGDRLWRALQDLVNEGIFPRLGISASFADEPLRWAARFSPALVFACIGRSMTRPRPRGATKNAWLFFAACAMRSKRKSGLGLLPILERISYADKHDRHV